MNDRGEELVARFNEAVETAIELGCDLSTSSLRIEFRYLDAEGELVTYGYGYLDDSATSGEA